MTESLKLPVGIENFEEIRSDGYYYVDKTKLIEQLVDSRGKVNLFYQTASFWQDSKHEYAQIFL